MSTRLHLPPAIRRLVTARMAKPAPLLEGARQRRACLYKVDRLGDFVLAIGALRRLIAHYGPGECRLVVSTIAAPLAAAEFPDVARWEVPADASGVLREIRPLRRRLAPVWAAESFTDVVCLRHARSVYRNITLGWIHAQHWHGLGPQPVDRNVFVGHRPEFVADYPAAPRPPWCRELLAHREVVGRATGVTPDWSVLRPQLCSVQPSTGANWIFCPFGSEPNRDFPEDRWIEAWRTARFPVGRIEVLGPASRHEELARMAARLRQEANRADVLVAANLPPMEFVARLAAARGIVTVESAAAHFATAFDKPAVIVTGGGHFGCLAPWGEGVRQRWLATPMPCFGCEWECPFSTVHCLVEQSAESVAQALREMIAHG